jgi:uncharacterized protein (TIGR02117 family)
MLCPIPSLACTSLGALRKSARVWIALLPVMLAACSSPMQGAGEKSDESTRTIFVVRHDWHTGLLIKVADITDQNWPVLRDFPSSRYLEVGWGDRGFYPAREPNVWLGIKALFWPTPGTLHVIGIPGAVEEWAPQDDIVALKLTPLAMERLYLRLRAGFDLDVDGNAVMLGPGLYGDSRFYASREVFSLFKTCNVWTAQVLRESGVAVNPLLTWSASSLLSQLQSQRQLTALPAHEGTK